MKEIGLENKQTKPQNVYNNIVNNKESESENLWTQNRSLIN